MPDYFASEETRQYLLSYVEETEDLLRELLISIDHNASCRIYPSLDLGFPHDVVRIAGGFPTGILVTWQSNTPFVPVDTTVNVCTTSMFKLGADILQKLNEEHFAQVMQKLERSSYNMNFQRGNHFISYVRSNQSGDYYLVIHTSASEFKKTYNGLFPIPGNWYMDDVQVYQRGNRHIRYITGKKAEMFVRIAHQIEPYNVTRHEFFAEVITDGICEVTHNSHHHHYYMPTDQSVLIGGFVVDAGATVPILTYPGDPLFSFRVNEADKSVVRIGESEKHLIPHGWGKYSTVPPSVSIDLHRGTFELNGVSHKIDSSSSLRAHPDLSLRRFGTKPDSDNYYFDIVKNYVSGNVVDDLSQLVSYNKLGFRTWMSGQ